MAEQTSARSSSGSNGKGRGGCGAARGCPCSGAGDAGGDGGGGGATKWQEGSREDPGGCAGGAQGCVCAQGNTHTSVLCGFCDGTTGLRVSRGKGTSGTGGTFRGSSELCPQHHPCAGTPRGPWDPELQATERGGGTVTGSWVRLGTAWGCPQPRGGHRAPQAALCLRSPRRARAPHGWGSGHEQRTKLIKGIK